MKSLLLATPFTMLLGVLACGGGHRSEASPALPAPLGATLTRIAWPVAPGTDPLDHYLNSLTLANDGSIWFLDNNSQDRRVLKFTPGTGFQTFVVQAGWDQIRELTPDLNDGFWFKQIPNPTYPFVRQVWHVSSSGTLTAYPMNCGPQTSWIKVTLARDGTLWWGSDAGDAIVRASLVGDQSSFSVPFPWNPSLDSYYLTNGPDDHLWFTQKTGLGKIDLKGQTTLVPLLPDLPVPTNTWRVGAGRENEIWTYRYQDIPGSPMSQFYTYRIDVTSGETLRFPFWVPTDLPPFSTGDGTYWAADMGGLLIGEPNDVGGKILRFDQTRILATYNMSSAGFAPSAWARDPSGTVWFINHDNSLALPNIFKLAVIDGSGNIKEDVLGSGGWWMVPDPSSGVWFLTTSELVHATRNR